MTGSVDEGAIGNRVLDAISEYGRERLLGDALPRHMPLNEPLFRPDERISEVHFPLTGVMTVVSMMEDGSRVEVAAVGSEGMVGLPVYFGIESVKLEAFSQVPGDVISVPVARFKEEVAHSNEVRHALNRYAYALMFQIGQSAACNAVHTVEQRAGRWLLMAHDRMQSNEFQLTQEVLAQMLGVRAATISEKASRFQSAGLISYQRGRVAVLDRPGLERIACECYRMIRDEYTRQFGNGRPTDTTASGL